eukprot:CAMPEP_0113307738 /NCGR_PEP_ID=MMETSP0010_2-20120614/6466_1 /TAXON_ID=216773 ORGANISM="Corethron hystrix, Strain 308" /NCGR_SAMPLE_ID=MMETSP0010_2 /ASSEMBLY_ACC=CAM_ASM_000155 /LENGTH=301 /DNA_ID=CAMNT_0000162659 /DNA_START=81 /DNA_END=986 /DNA_ORIENTATION=- /assembly_acc=CAM_ASM_000155
MFTASYAPPRAVLLFSLGSLLLPFATPFQRSVAFAPSSLSHRRPTAIFGWGPEPVWSSAEVLSVSPAPFHSECVCLTVAAPEAATEEETFQVPGQYVQVRAAGDEECKPSFFALANSPAAAQEGGCFEFLIKKNEGNAYCTSDVKEGDKIDVSQVLGNGFPIADHFDGLKYDFPTQNILLFAAGTGIAPIRSAIESGSLKLDTGRQARLYYGCRSPQEMAYAERFSIWEKEYGVQVVPVVSGDSAEWPGRTGYVQNALEEDGVAVARNTGVLLCGMKGMAEGVKDIVTKAGVFEGRVLTNF